jgi:hypothetical protein
LYNQVAWPEGFDFRAGFRKRQTPANQS